MSVVTLSNHKQFSCSSEVTILDAASNQGVILEHSCRTGRCGICKTKVVSGNTHILKHEDSLSSDDVDAGFILTCCRSAVDDVEIEAEDLERLASIKMQTLPSRIDSISRLAPDVIQIILRLPPKNNFDYLAGQYINVIGKNGIRRSYSVANSRSLSEKIELHIRQVANGEMSNYWFGDANHNDLLRIDGPHGTFCFREKNCNNIVFLATGTGIAPVKSMLEDLNCSPVTLEKKIHVYWGGRVPEDIYWQPQFENLNISFHPVLSRASESWAGRRGYVQDALVFDGVNLSDSVVYACGSDGMIHSAQQLLLAHGLRKNNFYSDAFVSSK